MLGVGKFGANIKSKNVLSTVQRYCSIAMGIDSTRLLHQTSWSEDFVEHRQEKKVQTGVTTI